MKKFFAKIIGLFVVAVLALGGAWAVKEKPNTASATTEAEGKAIDLYLIAGQSNAVGSTLIDGGMGYPNSNNADDTVYENVWYSGRAHSRTDGSGAYQIPFSANEYVTQGHGYTSSRKHIGPEYGMAQFLNTKYADSDRDCAIIKSAAGGTKLLGYHSTIEANKYIYEPGVTATNHDVFGSWYPESLWDVRDSKGEKLDLWTGEYYYFKTGHQYRAFIDWVDYEVQYLKEQGYTDINFKALCWMQGESDCALVEQYRSVFATFCSDVRTTLSERTGVDCSQMPFVVGEISDTFGSYSGLDRNVAFNDMLNEIQSEIPNVYTINTGDYWINDLSGVRGSDSAHWSYSDMVEIGRLFGETAYKSSASARRLYMKKFSTSTVLYTSPTGKCVPSAYMLDGEDSVTLDFSTEKEYKIKEIGYIDGDERIPFTGEDNYEVVNDVRKYKYVVDVPEEGHLNMYVHYVNANKLKATCSVKDDDTTFGNRVSTGSMQNNGDAYEDASFYFNVMPKANGRLKRASINGIEIPSVMGLTRIEIADISEYVIAGSNALNIEVEYEQCDVLSITNPKLTYIVGEPFTTAESEVVLTYPDGTSKVLSIEEYEIDDSGFDKLMPGTYPVVIKRLGASPINLTTEVIRSPLFVGGVEEVYSLGNGFDVDDITVSYQNVDRERITLASGEFTVETNFNKDVVGNYTLTVTADSKYPYPPTTITIKVVEPITISVSGQDTVFHRGDDFTWGDMVVKAVGATVNKNLSPSEYTVDSSAYDKNTVGEYEIIISADGAEDISYIVSVIEPCVGVKGVSTVFNVGDNFSSKGIEVEYVDKTGTYVLRSSEYTIDSTAYDKNTAGEYTITVTTKEVQITAEDYSKVVSCQYVVKVVEPTLTISGYKTEFATGDTFSVGDLVVTYTDKKGENALSASAYTVDSSACNMAVAGEYTVSVSAKNITKTYQIVVTGEPVGENPPSGENPPEGGNPPEGENPPRPNTGSQGGCASRAGDIVLLVSALCAMLFVSRKVGKA